VRVGEMVGGREMGRTVCTQTQSPHINGLYIGIVPAETPRWGKPVAIGCLHHLHRVISMRYTDTIEHFRSADKAC
jgi:hypothetical protein